MVLERLSNTAVLDAEAPCFLQSGVWARFKAEFGWQAHGVRYHGADESGVVSVLSRRIGPGLRLGYVPHGGTMDAAQLAVLSTELLQKGGLNADCTFLRWDLPGEDSPELRAELSRHGLRPAPVDVQAPNTVVVDLSRPADELLAAMKSKTRYNIRLAERKGVDVREEGVSSLNDWYALYRQTAERDRIQIHSFQYYRRLFELQAESEHATLELLCARHEGELIAGICVVYFQDQATYLYGAGSDRKRNLMAAYLLQWRAIERAQARGCLSYDLFGIPPNEDPSHPMHGLYRFKVGFGGRVLRRLGCYDFSARPLRYAAFRVAETARNWYFKSFLKRR